MTRPTPRSSGSSAFDVAVVVTTFNRTEYLSIALESIVNQRFEGRWEVCVVDDGSTDDTPGVVQAFVDRYADPAGRCVVRYVKQSNQGLAAARNTGAAHTTAPFIAFVDDDDICEPRKLELQVAALRADPEAGLCHTSFRYIDAQGRFTDEGPQRVDNPCRGRCVHVLLQELVVISSTVMVRREVLMHAAAAEPHGLPYDPRWVRSQDYDMALRMARLSAFVYVPTPLLRYRFHESNIAMSKGNIKRAFGYHCQVQMDFAHRYGAELGVSAAEARDYAANFLAKRAESFFWRRELQTVRELCALAAELHLSDPRFDALSRKAARPAWLYRAKDWWDRVMGRGGG